MKSRFRNSNGKGRRWIDPQDFRDLRRQAGMTRRDAAEALDVTPRTIQNWETVPQRRAGGTGPRPKRGTRIPWMAYRMLRILSGYALPGPDWEGWTVQGDTLYAPNGRHFVAGELVYLEQTFSMARLWREMYARSGKQKTTSKVLPFPDRRRQAKEVINVTVTKMKGGNRA